MRLLLLFTLALALASQARIGETIEECRKRYGKEKEVSDGGWGMKNARFEKNGVYVVAKIKDRK